jgi:pantoate--beta-alanine ligase
VAKLLNVVKPHRAYFGQKDFQQTVVIRKVVRELGFDTDIVVCPIIREDDGLAMSSRNAYLDEDERKSAPILYKALQYGETLMMSGRENSIDAVKEKIRALMSSDPLTKIDYVEIVGPRYLEKIREVKLPAVICIAVFIGNTRLIDNIMVVSDERL